MIYLQSLTRSELAQLLLPQAKGETHAEVHAKQIFQWAYQRGVIEWDEMTDLSKSLRAWLKENVQIYRPREKTARQSVDGTYKVLWELDDGKTIESVVIPVALDPDWIEKKSFSGVPTGRSLDSKEWSRLTVCISSQVGCAMGCRFCL